MVQAANSGHPVKKQSYPTKSTMPSVSIVENTRTFANATAKMCQPGFPAHSAHPPSSPKTKRNDYTRNRIPRHHPRNGQPLHRPHGRPPRVRLQRPHGCRQDHFHPRHLPGTGRAGHGEQPHLLHRQRVRSRRRAHHLPLRLLPHQPRAGSPRPRRGGIPLQRMPVLHRMGGKHRPPAARQPREREHRGAGRRTAHHPAGLTGHAYLHFLKGIHNPCEHPPPTLPPPHCRDKAHLVSFPTFFQ